MITRDMVSHYDEVLLTVISCDVCEESLGTCRQLKFIEGKKIKYVLCDECGTKTDKQLKELESEIKLLKQRLERNETKYDGG